MVDWKKPFRKAGDVISPVKVLIGLVLLSMVIWTVTLSIRLSGMSNVGLDYPQKVIQPHEKDVPPGFEAEDLDDTANLRDIEALMELHDSKPREELDHCARSETIATMVYILDVLVNDNVWAPADPMYKIGWFGVVSFPDGPLFDNQASFQMGALGALRRMAVEMVDALGRLRGTTAADPDLQAARNNLFYTASAWRFNPFDSTAATFSTPADASYREARNLLQKYNDRLAKCDARFDPRSDNLYDSLDRIAKDLGGMTDQLAERSQAQAWDVKTHQMVDANGSNAGIFDFHADNYFYEAKGMMWAYHGLFQAMRTDFSRIVDQRDLASIWDRIEQHVAETAALDPLIVSNGSTDSVLMADHLAVMATNILRARANITESRDILNR